MRREREVNREEKKKESEDLNVHEVAIATTRTHRLVILTTPRLTKICHWGQFADYGTP